MDLCPPGYWNEDLCRLRFPPPVPFLHAAAHGVFQNLLVQLAKTITPPPPSVRSRSVRTKTMAQQAAIQLTRVR